MNSQEPSRIVSKQNILYIEDKGIVVQNTFRLYQSWIFTVTFEQLTNHTLRYFFLGLFCIAWSITFTLSGVCFNSIKSQLWHDLNIFPSTRIWLKNDRPPNKMIFKTNCELEDCSGSRCTKHNHKISFIRLLFASLPLPTLDKSCLLIVICWICVSGIC